MNNIYKQLQSSLGSEYENEYGTKSMRKFTKPKIFHGGDEYDMSKRWYVYFSFRNPKTGLLERQRPIYMKVNHKDNNKTDRLKLLKEIQQETHKLLKEGYSPYPDEHAPKQHFTAEQALMYAFEIKQSALALASYKDYEYKTKQFIKFLTRHNLKDISIKEIDKAIEIYEENILIGYPATHSYNRLIILYKRKKDINKEVRVLKRAIDIFSKENERRCKRAIKNHKEMEKDILCAFYNNVALRDINNMICFNPYDIKKYLLRLEKLQK